MGGAAHAEIDIDIEALARTRTWRDLMAAFARSLRDVLRRHPSVLVIIATRPAYTPPCSASPTGRSVCCAVPGSPTTTC